MSFPDEPEIRELRALLHEHGLVPNLPVSHRPDPSEAERTLQRVMSGAQSPRRRSMGWMAAAAAVVVGAAVIWTVTTGSEPAAAYPAPLSFSISDANHLAKAPVATPVLLDLAEAAQGVAPPGAGEFQRVTTAGWLLAVDTDTGTVEVAVTQTDSRLAPDGSAQISQSRGPALDVHGRLKPSSLALPGHGDTGDALPAGSFDSQLPATLPRDPDALRKTLLTLTAGMQCKTPAEQTTCIVDEIQQLYGTYVMPGDLAGALWRVLASEAGVRDLGDTTDRLGRPARALAVPSSPDQASQRVQVLLASPSSGRLIGTETVTLRDAYLGLTSPAVTGFQTWLDVRFVERIGS
ncbi:hypothetical protein Xcel_3466 (plasmid) [Xylanimonas cellulosilytica DSM 15894]|uniref:Uncharacterized protein n=1 Tax=Xylanimonas cellulosilytica (strain DSM 15894 / JCM 12276 / CECT 5975 / KCTC 9989 / LMG 20990 / NBRC 107835 / XIL07) TaxID=446471 RepID=D1C0Z9_XYLCX|nr:CU044_5270 family protein [Xylanimonas cellulosilytica]ACZ32465.1 hypothetical protein Xcel_3466 [Xylanimonas cellulosilytica DSM 15894]